MYDDFYVAISGSKRVVLCRFSFSRQHSRVFQLVGSELQQSNDVVLVVVRSGNMGYGVLLLVRKKGSYVLESSTDLT